MLFLGKILRFKSAIQKAEIFSQAEEDTEMEDGSGDSYGEFNSFQNYLIPFHDNTVPGFQTADLCPPSLLCADRYDGR